MSKNKLGRLAVALAATVLLHASAAAADGDECRLRSWRYVSGNKVWITIDDGSERMITPPLPGLILSFDWRRQLYVMPDYQGHKAWISSQYLADCKTIVQTCVGTDVSGNRDLSTRGLNPPSNSCSNRDGMSSN